jgi:hypothetical protein
MSSLLELCRRGVLELGLRDGEPTYRITPEFGEALKECNRAILAAGGYDMDPLGMIAAMALVHWCGSLQEAEAHELTNVLTGVLRSIAT